MQLKLISLQLMTLVNRCRYVFWRCLHVNNAKNLYYQGLFLDD